MKNDNDRKMSLTVRERKKNIERRVAAKKKKNERTLIGLLK